MCPRLTRTTPELTTGFRLLFRFEGAPTTFVVGSAALRTPVFTAEVRPSRARALRPAGP